MVLLTGGTGFLGRVITAELLNAGREVRLLVRNPDQADLPWGDLVEIFEGDARDPEAVFEALEGVSQVVHAAARVSFWRKEAEAILEENVSATANVVNMCLEANVEKMILVSSISAISTKSQEVLNGEGEPWQAPLAPSPYGRSKFESELEVHRGVAEGLGALIVNPGVVLGPDEASRSSISGVLRRLEGGLRYYTRGVVPVVGAQDVGRAIALLLDRPEDSGERFILVSENLNNRAFLQALAETLGVKHPATELPGWLLRMAGWLNEQLPRSNRTPPALTYQSARAATSHNRYDGSRITSLGFSYQSPSEAIQQTVASYLLRSRKQTGKM